MTLYDAIARVLVGGQRLSAADIARTINLRGLYARGDGRLLPASQIGAHVSSHPELFGRDESLIWLVHTSPMLQSHGADVQPAAQMHRPDRPVQDHRPVFVGLGCIGELMEGGLPSHDWLKHCGVYVLRTPAGYTPQFIPPVEALAARNVIRPWSTDRLRVKWVSGADVIYIGVAGRHRPRTLQARLRDLLNHASERTIPNGPHCGGEIVWQLQNHRELLLSAAATADPPVPRETEHVLIAEFKRQYGVRPFGNRQD